MKTSELIRAAIPLMRTGPLAPGTIGLCLALERADETSGTPGRAYEAAKARIREQLGYHSWAYSWLVARGVPEHKLMTNRGVIRPTPAMQAWRREWAERLAAEFEAEGD
jgi:hypothetical protein